MDTTPSGTKDSNNVECWSGFFKTDKEAGEHLAKEVAVIARYKKIVSAKKTLIEQKNNKQCHGMLLFKFVVVTCAR